ncbi:MAG TPA: hypothetical protein VFN89_02500, partial [Solirubrobacterales bacterium]|nr:hypothetical protein [Solirubrobacterales bacterium]
MRVFSAAILVFAALVASAQAGGHAPFAHEVGHEHVIYKAAGMEGRKRRLQRVGAGRPLTKPVGRKVTRSLGQAAGPTALASHKASSRADTTAPDTTIVSAPAGTVATSSVSVKFKSSEKHSTFRCVLDGAGSSCSSPVVYTGLVNGPHTFSVAAIDRSGNVDPSPASVQFTVNVTPPAVAEEPSPAPAPEEPPAPAPEEPAPAPEEPPASEPPLEGPVSEIGCTVTFPLATGSWPSGCWHPYAGSSPFNQK